MLGVRRLLADRGNHGRSMAEPIHVLIVDGPVLANPEASRHAADVRMGGVHAAVDHGHHDAFSGALG